MTEPAHEPAYESVGKSAQESPADAVIAALASGAATTSALASGLTAEQLREETAPGEWTRAQVLSHLGSGAVINQAQLDAAVSGAPYAGGEENPKVWARWDAMSPEEQRDGYLEAEADLQRRFAGFDSATKETLRTDLGFLPMPVDLAAAARFRLNEATLHGWDLRVLDDPTATLPEDAVAELIAQGAFMIGWVAKSAALDGESAELAVTLTSPAASFGLSLGDSVSVGDVPADPDGTLAMPAEAWLRLLTGRLKPHQTPTDVEVTGPVSLDRLREVFPGF